MYKVTNSKNDVVALGNFGNVKIAVLSELADQLQKLCLKEQTESKNFNDLVAQLKIVSDISELDLLKEYIYKFDWTISYLTIEFYEVLEFFELSTFEDYDADKLYNAIHEILNKLKTSGFNFDDIKNHFQNYDFIVIEDIYVAMHYVNITDNLKEFMEDEDAEEFGIVAQNDKYTLLIG